MRTDKQLDSDIRAALAIGCDVEINAYDDVEAVRLRALLRGRHGAARVSVRLADPTEALPIMDRIRGQA